MSSKITPDLLKSFDFELALKVMDKFVENVLVGTNKHQKTRLLEKFKRYQELSELLVEEDEDDFPDQRNIQIDVPDEIWLKIFRFLNYKDIFKNLSLVNKHFNNLTLDSGVIKSIDLKKICDKTKLQNKLEVLKRSRNIRHINVAEFGKSTNRQLKQVLSCNPNLKSLYLLNTAYYNPNGNQIRREMLMKTNEIIKKYANQIEHLKFDHMLLRKEEYLALANMPGLKCFKIIGSNYPLSSEEILLPLGFNCKKLECLELDHLHDFQFDVNNFDNFFEKRKNTLKRLRIRHDDPLIFQNLNLCQNIEQLVLEGKKLMTDECFYSISQLPSLRTLKIENVPNETLENANWPALEMLWLIGPEEDGSEDSYRKVRFTDKCINALLSNSPKLKSIRFEDPEQCGMSNKFLFETCKKTNVFISFGGIEYSWKNLETVIKSSPQQLEMEKYFCFQDFDVYNKYKNMKNEFTDWLNRKDDPWFNCINLDTTG